MPKVLRVGLNDEVLPTEVVLADVLQSAVHRVGFAGGIDCRDHGLFVAWKSVQQGGNEHVARHPPGYIKM
jgi:hypothetical protein